MTGGYNSDDCRAANFIVIQYRKMTGDYNYQPVYTGRGSVIQYRKMACGYNTVFSAFLSS